MDTPAIRKARGAFFTPPALARFITDWAIRSGSDRVLEPSCGDAAFLLPAAARLRSLGARGRLDGLLNGVEIHAPSAAQAQARLDGAGAGAMIQVGDFFDASPGQSYDAVVGNPPFVRYQQFIGDARAKSLRAALAQGVRLTGLASSWAAFTIHASDFLAPEGRLGLVLPAELLTVNYAAEVRRFLLQRFAKVKLVLFDELVFPDVLEEVVLLLAEGRGGCAAFEVYQARNPDDLRKIGADSWVGYSPAGDQKWTPALLPAEALDQYTELVDDARFTTLIEGWGETYLGAVTGNNKFFTLTRAEAKHLGLRTGELLPISPPGSKHLQAMVFGQEAWEQLAAEGKRCFLFAPGDKPSAAARAYIAEGEREGVHQGYKCRQRVAWWRVPMVECPDLFFTYMNHDRARLVTNDARAHVLNSLYGVRLNEDVRELGRGWLPLASLNTISLLGGEMVGRAYGGGMLKHEPKEADLMPVPSAAIVAAASDDLEAIRPQVGRMLRAGKTQDAIELIDRAVLVKHCGLGKRQLKTLRDAREHLFQRRVSRARGERVTV